MLSKYGQTPFGLSHSERVANWNMRWPNTNCKFTTSSSMGHMVSILNAGITTNKEKLRSVLRFCKVYRRFIDDSTGLAHPLKTCEESSTRFLQVQRWTDEVFRQPNWQDLITSIPGITRIQAPIISFLRCKWLCNLVCSFQTHPNGEWKQIGFGLLHSSQPRRNIKHRSKNALQRYGTWRSYAHT